MALSMDEQRMLAEIEARLSAEDPGLAARMSSFRRSSPAAKLRSPRGRLVGSLFAVALAVVISLMVYAMIPFRTHSPGKGTSTPVASGNPSAAAPIKPLVKPATSAVAGRAAASAGQRHTEAAAATTQEATTAGASKAGTATAGTAKTGTTTAGTAKTGTTAAGTAKTSTVKTSTAKTSTVKTSTTTAGTGKTSSATADTTTAGNS